VNSQLWFAHTADAKMSRVQPVQQASRGLGVARDERRRGRRVHGVVHASRPPCQQGAEVPPDRGGSGVLPRRDGQIVWSHRGEGVVAGREDDLARIVEGPDGPVGVHDVRDLPVQAIRPRQPMLGRGPLQLPPLALGPHMGDPRHDGHRRGQP
jgi:hypothetical protein